VHGFFKPFSMCFRSLCSIFLLLDLFRAFFHDSLFYFMQFLKQLDETELDRLVN
jgi:hypothetical protein